MGYMVSQCGDVDMEYELLPFPARELFEDEYENEYED
jgi:hypothetical protein